MSIGAIAATAVRRSLNAQANPCGALPRATEEAKVMAFDPRRSPDAMTIADLLKVGMSMGVHCHLCGRHVVLNAATLALSPELPDCIVSPVGPIGAG